MGSARLVLLRFLQSSDSPLDTPAPRSSVSSLGAGLQPQTLQLFTQSLEAGLKV